MKAPPKKATSLTAAERHERFVKAAREAGASESQDDFDEAFERVARPKMSEDKFSDWDGEAFRKSCWERSLVLESEISRLPRSKDYEWIYDNNSALLRILRTIGETRAPADIDELKAKAREIGASKIIPSFINDIKTYKASMRQYLDEIENGDLKLLPM